MTTLDQFPQPIDFTITGVIETDDSIGGWSIVPLPGVVEELGTRKAVKVGGTIDGVPFKATIMPWADGTQMIPVNAGLRKKLGKGSGDEVTIHLVERFT